jgi:hypothetical protein
MNMIAKLAYASALAVCGLVASATAPADAANFAGTWSVSGRIGNPVVATSAPICVFRQSGNAIAGSCKGPNGIGSADGSVNGNAILWHWHVIATNSVGLAGTATYHGVWGSDGVIRGTWTHSRRPGYYGPFTAQRV